MDSTTQKLVNDALTRAVQKTISTKNDAIHELNQGLSQATDRNLDLSGRLGDSQIQNIQLINRMNEVQRELNAEREKTKKLSQQVASYEFLLKKPLAEIAQANDSFNENYEKTMELLADWMVSQKAFKELAIQLGAEKGLSVDTIIQQGKRKKLDVIENKNDISHKTNASDDRFIIERIESLKKLLTN